MLIAQHLEYGASTGLLKDENESWDAYRLRLFLHTYNGGEPLHAVTIFFNIPDHTSMNRDHKVFLALAENAHDEGGIDGLKTFAKEYTSKN